MTTPKGARKRIRPYTLFAGLLAAVFLSVSLSGQAASAGGVTADPGAGRRIADRLCSRCHAVGPEGASPLAAAPPFRTLGRRWPVDNLAEALAEGIVTGHSEMPKFELSPQEIDDFLAWLEAGQTR